jgi:hypothetical protein
VSPEQQSASADVPPFAAIANSTNFDPKRLAYFLLEPHPKMPQMAISRSAADDIAAYIEALKKQAPFLKGGWPPPVMRGSFKHLRSLLLSIAAD